MVYGGSDGGPEPKRRKVRKGTQSCWECKRRKIRCIFSAASAAICDDCRRRGTACIGQEFADGAAPATQVEDRLSRVEAMVEQLASTANLDSPPRLSDDHGSQKETPREARLEAPKAGPEGFHGYHGLCDRLAAAWPGQHDLDLIWSLAAKNSDSASGSIYTPSSNGNTPSSRDVLHPPFPGCHPVLMARKLLLLGCFLQGIRPCSSSAGGLSTRQRDSIMSRAVETAHNLVTCNDELVDSVEGVECLFTESMYYNNAGHLRRAWLAVRRAMLMAQLTGLQRGIRKVVELDTRTRIDPMEIWFRLIQMDRYLSLMLGLAQGSLDNSFAEPKVLEGCTPIERMQRIQCVAAGRILQRNQAEIDDGLFSVHEIDKVLHEATALMPPRWWLPPCVGDNAEKVAEPGCIMDLFTHHHLLTRLHLPYLLRCSSDHRYDYSKITVINSSREVLSRFVSFRKPKSTFAYCRGVDYSVFVASTALCVAHIEARQGDSSPSGAGGCTTFYTFLLHQRLADRGMMESALEIMELTAEDGTDKIASKIAGILRRLLEIEADAAAGGTYRTNSSHEEQAIGGGELEYGNEDGNGGNVLRIHIPYLGTIKIERRGISKSSRLDSLAAGEHGEKDAAEPQTANVWAGYQSINQDGRRMPSNSGSVTASELSGLTAVNCDIFSSSGADGFDDAQMFVPGLATGVDDWALQGVDLAFFDSLLCGVAEEDFAEEASGRRALAPADPSPPAS